MSNVNKFTVDRNAIDVHCIKQNWEGRGLDLMMCQPAVRYSSRPFVVCDVARQFNSITYLLLRAEHYTGIMSLSIWSSLAVSVPAVIRSLTDTHASKYNSSSSYYLPNQGGQIWHPNWVRLAPNGTNLGIFKISFSTFWLAEPKCTEADLKKSQICAIQGQSDPIWIPNFPSLLSVSDADLQA